MFKASPAAVKLIRSATVRNMLRLSKDRNRMILFN